MKQLLRMPPRGRSGAWLIALGIALVLAVQPIWPDRTAVGVVGAIGLTLLAAMRWRLRWPLVLASVDGSNDTSAGLLILLSLAVAARRPAAGAAFLAVAVAFKPYAIAWIVPLVAWAGLPSAAAFLGASAIAWSPVWMH